MVFCRAMFIKFLGRVMRHDAELPIKKAGEGKCFSGYFPVNELVMGSF